MDLDESESVGVNGVRGQPKPLDTHRHTFFPAFCAASHKRKFRRVSIKVDD
jgi:hypothetical protein